MNNKEEILEEIEDVSVINDTKKTDIKEDTGILAGIDVDAALNNTSVIGDNINIEQGKNKTVLIVLLSSLLAIDVVALIIYIIGIDKVLTFIK